MASEETSPKVKTGRLGEAFVHLLDGAGAKDIAVEVGSDFWSNTVGALPPGRLVSCFDAEDDWAMWEMHPAGDELLIQLSGVAEMILEREDGEERLRLAAGDFLLIPAGVWHTADVAEPCRTLFITRGEDTEHRAR